MIANVILDATRIAREATRKPIYRDRHRIGIESGLAPIICGVVCSKT